MTITASRRAVSVYVTAVIVLAGLALTYVSWASIGQGLGRNTATFWLLAGCGFVTEMLPLRWLALDNHGEVTASWTFVVAMLFVAPPSAAISVTALLFLVSDVRARKPIVKMAFNVADIVLSLSLGAAVLSATGQATVLESGSRPDLLWFPVTVLTISIVFCVNTLVTCGVIGLAAGIPVSSVLRDHGADALPTDAMFLALSPIFVVTAQRSLFLVPPLVMTTAIVYRTARLSLSRRHDSTHDLLTGIANRRLFDQHLQRALESAALRVEHIGLVLVDLDGFKAINDNLGHQIGDQVLVEVARRLQAACRHGDLVARLGGDEFAILVPNVDQAETPAEVTRRILGLFDEPFEIDGIPLDMRASAGVAVAPEHGRDAQTLLRRADEAMYSAKNARSTVEVYRAGHNPTAIGRLGLLNDLTGALSAGELFLEYQPQIDLSDGRPVGAEALIRWQHPVVGLIPPGTFMPLAEQTDLIADITEFALRTALAQSAEWRGRGLDLNLAVNVSVRNLEHARFCSQVAAVLAESGVAPERLTIELTENTMALEHARVRDTLGQLTELGVSVAIDDFGTGYSSIVKLRDLPFSQIKLDRTFVQSMADSSRDALIVRNIIQLADVLGVETVAEGVEDEMVTDLLRDLGCKQAQGYFFGRPMAAEALVAWAARQDRWGRPAEYSQLDPAGRPVVVIAS